MSSLNFSFIHSFNLSRVYQTTSYLQEPGPEQTCPRSSSSNHASVWAAPEKFQRLNRQQLAKAFLQSIFLNSRYNLSPETLYCWCTLHICSSRIPGEIGWSSPHISGFSPERNIQLSVTLNQGTWPAESCSLSLLRWNSERIFFWLLIPYLEISYTLLQT
jgi:hypothetical protein